MKAKPKTGIDPASSPVDGPGDESGEYFVSKEDMEAYEEWARIRAELGEDEGKVVLKRRNPKGQLAMLDFMSVVDFSIDRVMQDWGGGRYIATAFKNGAKMGQIQFEIDENIPKRTPMKDTPSQPSVHAAAGPPADDQRFAAMERMIASNNDLMKTLLTAMVQKGGNGSDSALETGLKIAEMIRANSPPPPEKPSLETLKDIFVAGLEARQAADGGGEEGYLGVVKTFAEPITKVLNAALSRDRNVAAGSIPVPVRANPQPVPEQPVLPPGQAWLVHLQPHLNTIMSWARAGKDPELYAEVILDNIEPGAQMEIAEAAKDPELVSKTLAALPMFIPYSAWATATLTNIKDLLLTPPEEETGNGQETT